MGVDLKSCGWETPFHEGSPDWKLPDQLTKKWWDKNKQAVAKNSLTGLGKTGVGEALDKLGQRLSDLTKKGRPAIPSNRKLAPAVIEMAQDMINGSAMKEFGAALETVEELARKQAVIASKGKLTEKTGKVLVEIAEAAKAVGAAVSPVVLRGALIEATREAEKKAGNKEENVGNKTGFDAPGLLKLVQDRVNGVGRDMKLVADQMVILNKSFTKETRHTFAGQFASVCRNLTQGMTNAMKCNEQSGKSLQGFQAGAVKSLFEKVAPYAADTNGGFADKLDLEGVTELVNDYKAWALEFVKLHKPLKL